jgi:hypothetical protein
MNTPQPPASLAGLALILLMAGSICPPAAPCAQAGRRTTVPAPGKVQPAPAGPIILRIRVEDGLVVADIRNAPLHRVLEELAARTGIVFEVGMQDATVVSVSLPRVGIQEAIDRIASSHDRIYYHGPGPDGRERIQLVRIFSRARNVPQPSLRYIGTGEITKTGGDLIETQEQAIQVLAESTDAAAKLSAVEFLAAAKTDAGMQALLLATRDAAPEVRSASIEQLASLGARTNLAGIISAFKDQDPGVRVSAITAVSLLGDSDNLRDLRPMLRDANPGVAAAAEMAIRRLSVPRR